MGCGVPGKDSYNHYSKFEKEKPPKTLILAGVKGTPRNNDRDMISTNISLKRTEKSTRSDCAFDTSDPSLSLIGAGGGWKLGGKSGEHVDLDTLLNPGEDHYLVPNEHTEGDFHYTLRSVILTDDSPGHVWVVCRDTNVPLDEKADWKY